MFDFTCHFLPSAEFPSLRPLPGVRLDRASPGRAERQRWEPPLARSITRLAVAAVPLPSQPRRCLPPGSALLQSQAGSSRAEGASEAIRPTSVLLVEHKVVEPPGLAGEGALPGEGGTA